MKKIINKFNKLSTFVQSLIIIVTVSGTILTGTSKIVTSAVKEEIKPVNNYIQMELERLLTKQYVKIKKRPEDIKEIDVKQVLNNWKLIENKTTMLKVYYEEIKKYARKNY